MIKYAGELRLANVHSPCLFLTSLGYETYETSENGINKQNFVLKDGFQMKTI